MKTYMFPGQGSQFKGMGGALFKKFSDMTKTAEKILGFSIKELCLSDPYHRLHQTQYTQPAIYVVNAFSYQQKIKETGENPDFMVGHSLGEVNALEAAGAISFEDGLNLVKKRGELMSRAPKGAMAAILGPTEGEIKSILVSNDFKGIDIANLNSPTQVVISGLEEDIREANSFFEKRKVTYIPLNTSGAFHSRYMEPLKVEFERYLKKIKFSKLKIPVISNVHARPYRQDEIMMNLADQITNSVKLFESMRYLMGQGEMEFEEIGVGDVLTKLIINIQEQTTPLDFKNRMESSQTSKSATAEVVIPKVDMSQRVDSANEETVIPETETSKKANWRQEIEKLHEKINTWNNTYPVGTKVIVEGYKNELKTRTKAIILFGHRAAIYMQGYDGYFALDDLTPV